MNTQQIGILHDNFFSKKTAPSFYNMIKELNEDPNKKVDSRKFNPATEPLQKKFKLESQINMLSDSTKFAKDNYGLTYRRKTYAHLSSQLNYVTRLEGMGDEIKSFSQLLPDWAKTLSKQIESYGMQWFEFMRTNGAQFFVNKKNDTMWMIHPISKKLRMINQGSQNKLSVMTPLRNDVVLYYIGLVNKILLASSRLKKVAENSLTPTYMDYVNFSMIKSHARQIQVPKRKYQKWQREYVKLNDNTGNMNQIRTFQAEVVADRTSKAVAKMRTRLEDMMKGSLMTTDDSSVITSQTFKTDFGRNGKFSNSVYLQGILNQAYGPEKAEEYKAYMKTKSMRTTEQKEAERRRRKALSELVVQQKAQIKELKRQVKATSNPVQKQALEDKIDNLEEQVEVAEQTQAREEDIEMNDESKKNFVDPYQQTEANFQNVLTGQTSSVI